MLGIDKKAAFAASLVSLILLLHAAAASAEEDVKDAESLHKKGIELFKKGKFEEAMQVFQAADALAKSPANTFNIATCLEKLGRYDDALEAYQDYMGMEGALEKERAQESIDRILKIPAHLVLKSEPPGADVFLDGENQTAGTTPLKLEVKPGDHFVTMKKKSFRDATAEIKASRGESVEIMLRLDPIPKQQQPKKARVRFSLGGGYTFTSSNIILSHSAITVDGGAVIKSFVAGLALEYLFSKNSDVVVIYPMGAYQLVLGRGFSLNFMVGIGAMILNVRAPELLIPEGRYADGCFHLEASAVYSEKFIFVFIRPLLLDVAFGAGNIEGTPMVQYMLSAGMGFQF
jgi:hypothetical protein